MSTSPDKAALIQALCERIAQELRTLRESQRSAQEGATHEETRQEDPKDTRAIEAQYVARGFAERVEDLRLALATLSRVVPATFGPADPVGLTALVGLKHGAGQKVYFLVPVAGGETLAVGDASVQTLTPASPLGRSLCGHCVDDDVELDVPGRRLVARIDWIR